MNGKKYGLDEILKSVYALIKLDEAADQSSMVSGVISDIQGKLEPVLAPFKKKLGFLYEDLKGEQDVREFYYEMLAKE